MEALLGIGIFGLMVFGFFLLVILASAIRVVQEYERGVVFRLGRLVGARGPGLIILVPVIERMVKVDLREVPLDVPAQEVITRDNVTIRVNAVVIFRVLNPEWAVVKVTNHFVQTSLIAQTTLRDVIGKHELDEILAERDKLGANLQQLIDEATDNYGIKVREVRIKDIELPEEMRRAMARQAEAEREKRAKIIAADGEFQAAAKLTEAAKVIETSPTSLQLRYLQTLTEIAAENSSTVVFPLPIELMRAFTGDRK